MIKLKVNSIETAIKEALNFLPEQNTKFSICFTGGSFGVGLLNKISSEEIDISNWNIYQTDERLDATEKDIIQKIIISNLKGCAGYAEENCFFLPHALNGKTIETLAHNLQRFSKNRFDLTFLSLGEDGHIAGHFEESVSLTKDFCFIRNSPKPPKKRLSFKLEKFLESHRIVLACIGKEKKHALEKLLSGESFHSKLVEHERLILIYD